MSAFSLHEATLQPGLVWWQGGEIEVTCCDFVGVRVHPGRRSGSADRSSKPRATPVFVVDVLLLLLVRGRVGTEYLRSTSLQIVHAYLELSCMLRRRQVEIT
jgi:hypothetical protein